MARPYNKKTVDDAVLFCETVASNPHLGDYEWTCIFLGIRYKSKAYDLACAAYEACASIVSVLEEEWAAKVFAEAAALIRSGWMIDDEVSRLVHVKLIADANCPDGRVYMVQDGEPILGPTTVVFDTADAPPEHGNLDTPVFPGPSERKLVQPVVFDEEAGLLCEDRVTNNEVKDDESVFTTWQDEPKDE